MAPFFSCVLHIEYHEPLNIMDNPDQEESIKIFE